MWKSRKLKKIEAKSSELLNGPELLVHSIRDKDVCPQHQSPLYSAVPPEIRNMIFALALLYTYDKSRPFSTDTYYYRPDFLYRDRIDTSLLLTCRQVYLETWSLPLSRNDHVFWCYRGPHDASPFRFFSSLNDEQRALVERIHIFAQLYWFEDQHSEFSRTCRHPAFTLRSIHITIRHSDWWFWEHNNALELKDGWTESLRSVKRLEELVLELETIERDKDQMYAVAERFRKRHFTIRDGLVLKPDDKPPFKQEWMGPASYDDGHTYNIEGKYWFQLALERDQNVAGKPADQFRQDC
ncbi:hypothetical protein Moror_13872 [Moniliophthora roreri MCA 2997]|uniref:Uncharacterized protein n=1 Tax=Moniliophthora roreri (strain MCA 2997) TaxID=1381753 RepID=V2XRK6_MONRO|nr:hypothetical protein Moror_13872 [Moniliophthora roreri MCA 2997]